MSDTVTVELGGHVDISHVKELYENFKAVPDGVKTVCFNAISVKRADTAGLQCLLFFVRSLKKKGVDWSWNSVSFALGDATDLLGVTEELGL